MTNTDKYRQAFKDIAELPTDSKTWQEYAANNKPLDWINVNKAIAIANEMLELPVENRERDCLIILRNHFNSANKYAPELKIDIAKQIIEDGLGKYKKPLYGQLELGL